MTVYIIYVSGRTALAKLDEDEQTVRIEVPCWSQSDAETFLKDCYKYNLSFDDLDRWLGRKKMANQQQK